MKYPYIGKSPQGHYYLVVKRGLIYSFLSKSWLFELDGFADLKRVNHEYLEDTKVKIKSKEHRSFIQNIINCTGLYTARDGDILYIMSQSNNKSACKEITIPLPPKEPKLPLASVGTQMPEVKEPKKVSMNDIQVNVKNNTDSVVQVTKAEDERNIFICVSDLPKEPEPKEWPQIGDEVAWSPKLSRKGTLLNIYEGMAWLKDSYGDFVSIEVNKLKKPPTPEEELATLISNWRWQDKATIGDSKLAEAIINGEIKGLSYKPE